MLEHLAALKGEAYTGDPERAYGEVMQKEKIPF